VVLYEQAAQGVASHHLAPTHTGNRQHHLLARSAASPHPVWRPSFWEGGFSMRRMLHPCCKD
jgi:hypothetical protein